MLEESRSKIQNDQPLHVGRPNLGVRQVFDDLVDGIFERKWFTNHGEVVRTLERLLADHLGVKHCITVCNATVGLQAVLRSLDIAGEVILPSFTFVATAHAVGMSEGLKPVFADVNRDTHCLCPESVLSLINENTAAILGVHLWGNPCYPGLLKEIADAHRLKLVFDSAHAFHNVHEGVSIGNFGDCEVFSFHATKFFHTFEGGAITTNDDVLAARIRRVCNFGFKGPDEIGCIGTNAKMSEINAAMGISMFECIGHIANTNQENFEVYQAFLDGVPGLQLYSLDSMDRCNWQYVVLEIDKDQFGRTRDEVMDVLNSQQIFAKRYFFPGCHRLAPYRKDFEASGRNLVNTEYLSDRVLCLPTGTAIEVDQIHRVCQIILQMRMVKRRLPHFETSRQRKVGTQ